MNRAGRVVLTLMTISVLAAIIAATRGRFDGACLLATVSLITALMVTSWAHTNRKRTHQ